MGFSHHGHCSMCLVRGEISIGYDRERVKSSGQKIFQSRISQKIFGSNPIALPLVSGTEMVCPSFFYIKITKPNTIIVKPDRKPCKSATDSFRTKLRISFNHILRFPYSAILELFRNIVLCKRTDVYPRSTKN